VDFLCPAGEGYGELRPIVRRDGDRGVFGKSGLNRPQFPREPQIDQYGIRFPVVCGEVMVKVELIREARISLGPPARPSWSPVDCLSIADCFAEKPLANSDRWAGRQVLSRDLVDLGALCFFQGPIPEGAWEKAEGACLAAARSDLAEALAAFRGDPAWQERCREGLAVTRPADIPRGCELLHRQLTEGTAGGQAGRGRGLPASRQCPLPRQRPEVPEVQGTGEGTGEGTGALSRGQATLPYVETCQGPITS